MSHSDDVELVQAALSSLSSKAAEIRQGVLAYLVQSERLIVKDVTHDVGHTSSPRKHLLVTFYCEADDLVRHFPTDIANEYLGLRSLSWLKSETLFTNPYDFYMSHYMLANDSSSALPPIDRIPESLKTAYPLDFLRTKAPILTTHVLLQQNSKYPHLPHHGLERVVLDLDASEYISLFGVRVLPFNDMANHKDEHLVGAASFLQHCKELTITFGKQYRSVNPWSYLAEDQWSPDAAWRIHVCELGHIVDWIFEYAWANEFIQHIPKVLIKGTVQPWVREKWEKVFAQWNAAKNENSETKWQDIHNPDIEAIETRNQVPGQLWLPEMEYPPECHCAKGCRELEPEGKWNAAEPEPTLQGWEEFKEKLVGTLEWDDLRDKYGPLED